jgi:hypothetical protein
MKTVLLKLAFCAMVISLAVIGTTYKQLTLQAHRAEDASVQVEDDGKAREAMAINHYQRTGELTFVWVTAVLICVFTFSGEIKKGLDGVYGKHLGILLIALITGSGCYKPFEPVKLEVIAPVGG